MRGRFIPVTCTSCHWSGRRRRTFGYHPSETPCNFCGGEVVCL